MNNIKIQLNRLDENLLFKQMSLNVGGKSVVTPIKASYKKNPISEINEIYKKFSFQTLNNCASDESYERAVNSTLANQKTEGVNFLHVDYSDIQIPETQHIEALSDIQYENSDVVITPIWSSIIRKSNGPDLLEKFMGLTNRYLEIVSSLNHKAVIGTIPSKMPRQFLQAILNNYYGKGVTSFVIDFDGRSIMSNPSWIRNLFRIMKDLGILEKTFLYSINSNEGKFMKNTNTILAKDFMSIGFGVDVIGLNHIPPRMSTEAWEKLKSKRKENMFRLFNSKTYGYERKSNTDLKELEIYNREDLKRLNTLRQYDESVVLKEKLNHDNTLEPYVRTKSQINDSIINKIKKLRSQTFRK